MSMLDEEARGAEPREGFEELKHPGASRRNRSRACAGNRQEQVSSRLEPKRLKSRSAGMILRGGIGNCLADDDKVRSSLAI